MFFFLLKLHSLRYLTFLLSIIFVFFNSGTLAANGALSGKVSLAEVGTFQLEFRKLSQLSNDPKYSAAVIVLSFITHIFTGYESNWMINGVCLQCII